MEEVASLLKNHIDAVCVFLKAFKKHIGLNHYQFKGEHKHICEFLVAKFISKVKNDEKTDGILKFNKALQLSLQILHKSWKATLEMKNEKNCASVWFNHWQFRN